MCNLPAVVACAFNISLSCNIIGWLINSVVAFEPIAFVLKRENTAALASVKVTLILSPLPESSDTKILFIIALELLGDVYTVVLSVL